MILPYQNKSDTGKYKLNNNYTRFLVCKFTKNWAGNKCLVEPLKAFSKATGFKHDQTKYLAGIP